MFNVLQFQPEYKTMNNSQVQNPLLYSPPHKVVPTLEKIQKIHLKLIGNVVGGHNIQN